MSDGKFNQTQMSAACAVMHQFGVQHGATGTDIHQRTAVLAIFAIMLGRLNSVPEVYRGLIRDVDVGADLVETLEAPSGVVIPEGHVVVSAADAERWETILTGLLIDTTERNLTLTPEAAALLRQPDSDDDAFPTEGIYVPFTTATGMVEQVMRDAADPDTIIGKHVRESIAATATAEPDGDGKGKVNLEAMTVEGLRDFATENNVDLEGASKKGDIIARLREFGF